MYYNKDRAESGIFVFLLQFPADLYSIFYSHINEQTICSTLYRANYFFGPAL